MQEQTGLSLASDQSGIEVVLFDKRTLIHGGKFFGLWSRGVISRDGTEIAARYIRDNRLRLGIAQSDGSNLREYPDVDAQDICLSYDRSKMALTARKGSLDAGLEVMDLASNVTQEIDPSAKLTSQCWSPDDKKIVYAANNSVRVYEIGSNKSTILVLAQGSLPSWSSDGSWIAFLDHDTYYAIRPDGQARKKLFQLHGAESPLYWSPDSRIVAYVSKEGFFEGGWRAIDVDNHKLRVRRLEDNSEDWVAWVSEGESVGGNYQWITNSQLLQDIKSQISPH